MLFFSSFLSSKIQRSGRPRGDVEQFEAVGGGQEDATDSRCGGAKAQGTAAIGRGEAGGAQEEQRWPDDHGVSQEDQHWAQRVPQTDSTLLRAWPENSRKDLQVNHTISFKEFSLNACVFF